MAPGNKIGHNRPACCGAVENYVQARHRDAHKAKISGARSLINNGWSVREELKLQPSRRNTKNEQNQDARYSDIEKENMRLLLRMQEIGSRPVERRPEANGCGAGMAAARIVMGMPKPAGPASGLARCSSLPAKGRGSNSDARMRELRRIDDENQRLLKRLRGARPTVKNKVFEEQHQAQQKVMRMRQEQGPKMPASRVPLPFSMPPAAPLDPEDERIASMHAEMQRRVEELERMEGSMTEGYPETGDGAQLSPVSARSSSSTAAVGAGERRKYVGGTIPEHSRALVQQLMEEPTDILDSLDLNLGGAMAGSLSQELQQERRDEEAQDAANDKDALANLLAAADALEVNPMSSHVADPFSDAANYNYLSYENVVQRSRATLEALDA